jgi:hypothetical protein
MSRLQPLPNVLSRQELIAALRQELATRADGRSICAMAAEKGILCGGFRSFTDEQLRERFAWLVRRRPSMSRADLEGLGNAWQLGRQEYYGVLTACDVQRQEHDLCNGWDDFSDEELAGFYWELLGKAITVIPENGRQPAA